VTIGTCVTCRGACSPKAQRCRDCVAVRAKAMAWLVDIVSSRQRDGCWLDWPHYVSDGYPTLRSADGPNHERVSWIVLALDGFPRPAGLQALHSCDVPLCINPAHLRWGTHAENMMDMHSRGRWAAIRPRHGEYNGKAKLTHQQVEEIRVRYMQGGNTQRALAAEFRISQAQINNILLNKQRVRA
jgi:hypothetical protein